MFIQTNVVIIFTALVIGMIIWLIVLSFKIGAIKEDLSWHWSEIMDISRKFRQYRKKHKKQLDEDELTDIHRKLSDLAEDYKWSDKVVNEIIAIYAI